MKKVLLTTSILAFAGSAFAANASGYVLSTYKNVKGSTTASENGKSQFTETEIYLSGSKTASNGLTFGANYTIGWDGDNAKRSGAYSTVTTAFAPTINLSGDLKTDTRNGDTADKKLFIDALLSLRNSGRGIHVNKDALTRFASDADPDADDYNTTAILVCCKTQQMVLVVI